jgi:glycosyltransferase involved in cell wall biosynthesis
MNGMPSQRLRVAHIITQLELGGAQRNTLYTLGHLDAEQFEPFLICGPGGMLDEEVWHGSWPTHFIRWLVRPVHPIKDVLALVAIYKKLRELRPEIVHTHSSKAGILGRIAAYLAGVPVIIHTFHGFGFTPGQRPWVRRLFVLAEKYGAMLSTHLVFVSEDNRQEAIALGIRGAQEGSLIRSGIRFERAAETRIRRELDIPEDAWVVASVGNFKPQKNPMDLARVAVSVLQQDRSVYFILVGDGELRPEVERFCLDQGIAANVHSLGWRRDIPEILAASNSFLLTSLWEGLPRAIVEASAAELPCVAYGANGVKDIVGDGMTGFLIAPGDVAGAAEKVLWLKAHPEDAKRFGQTAARRVAGEFDIDRMVRQQEALYNRLDDAVPLKNHYESHWKAGRTA